MHVCLLSYFSHVRLFATLWTVALQAPLSVGFSVKNTGMDCHFLLQYTNELYNSKCYAVLSHSVMSNSLGPHGL